MIHWFIKQQKCLFKKKIQIVIGKWLAAKLFSINTRVRIHTYTDFRTYT